jgi:hypothetical protein
MHQIVEMGAADLVAFAKLVDRECRSSQVGGKEFPEFVSRYTFVFQCPTSTG